MPHTARSVAFPTSSLRIAHVISTPEGVGGAERTVAQLVRFGGERGWTQLVLNPFALDPDDPAHREFYAPAQYRGHRAATWSSLLGLRQWLIGELANFNPDIVHAHLFHASVLVASIRRPPGARLVLSHQHGDHFQATGARGSELLDRLAGQRYDRIVGCSRSVEDYLLQRHHHRARRVCHVHNGWSGEPVARHGDDHSIICIARFRAQKDHRTLIDALALVREQVPDARLKLVGDGSTQPEIEAYVRRRGLASSVDFLGETHEIWPLLAQSRVFALATLYEPLGIAVLEAMAAGLPVVATDVGGLPEIVEQGETGFLVRPRDPAEMATHLARLLTDRRTSGQDGIPGSGGRPALPGGSNRRGICACLCPADRRAA